VVVELNKELGTRRKFVRQGGGVFGPRYGSEDVTAAAELAQPGAGTPAGGPQGGRGLGGTGGDL
jgi:hypothetical protein